MMSGMGFRRRTEVVRSSERAIGLRKQRAESACTLGQDVTTPAWLLQEQWDLFGDERALVDAASRQLLMADVLEDLSHEDPDLPLRPTLGTVRLLADGVARYAGTEEFDGYLAHLSDDMDALLDLPAGQRAALNGIIRYLRALEERRLIEPAQAARFLAQEPAALHDAVQVAEPLFAAPAVEAWLAALDPQSSSLALPSLAMAEGAAAAFRFAAGATPMPRLVKDAVEEAVQAAEVDRNGSSEALPRVVVFAPDPRGLFTALAPTFAGESIQSACLCTAPFLGTNIGIALQAVQGLVAGTVYPLAAATDFAYQPLSGLRASEAQALNTAIRADALMTREEILDRIRQASPTFAAFERVIQEQAAEAVAALEEALDSCEAIKGLAQEDFVALSELAALLETAQGLGAGNALPFAQEMPVRIALAAQASEQARASVEFRGMDAMDALPPASADAVVFADLTKDAIPIKRARPATESLFALMGIHDERDLYQEKRAAFATAARAARTHVACIMPVRGAAGQQLYPSFLFDELVDAVVKAQCDGKKRAVDADGIFMVPDMPGAASLLVDEVDVVGGFGRTFAPLEGEKRYPRPIQGHLAALSMDAFMRRSEIHPDLPLLSASQIECYNQCPYRWFIERKVAINALDEMLDNLSMGTFAHEVFRRTFDELAASSITRVDAENVTCAQTMAARVFDEMMAAQPDEEPGQRCAVVSTRDALAMADLREGILDAIGFMPLMPEGFSVFGGELEIKDADGATYAGAVIRGSVDRVDVDPEAGAFTVLDYKGSVGGHEAGTPAEGLDAPPGFIQTLVYAQVVRQLPAFADMACVGALYLSYRAQGASGLMAGSFDRLRYPAQDVADASKSQVSMDFQEFLDAVEEALIPVVRGMQEGVILPRSEGGGCAYCPLTFCQERRG